MTKINLLPWREQLREEQQKQFYYLLGICVAVCIGLMIILHLIMNYQISQQVSRNKRLMQENRRLDSKISVIRSLKDDKYGLITRINIIKTLQANRPQAVYLFEEMNKIIPSGIVLTKIERKKSDLIFSGVADSHTHISLMMKNVRKSPWMKKPILDEIKARKNSHGHEQGAQYFKLRVQVTMYKSAEESNQT